MKKYILNKKGEPVEEKNLSKWAKWFEKANRHIGYNEVGKVTISTVFLSLDHNFSGGAPILWETMIFGGKHDGYQRRYTTKKQALAGHKRAVKLVSK